MGYTHYWRRPKKDHEQEAWTRFIADCKYLYKHMPEHAGDSYADEPLILSGCYRYKKPVFNNRTVHFNGASSKERVKSITNKGWVDFIRDDKKVNADLGHETFILYRKAWKEKYPNEDKLFDCCKTARKPYDLMVTACLILYKYHFPDVDISSDGEDEDWAEAWKFIANTLPNGSAVVLELRLSEFFKRGD